ncbi:MAG: hypothetical protein LUI10_08350 [Lachnospiraceae bacterium]|nr:hypothetical protein [Lachnospiraceae bacterium]
MYDYDRMNSYDVNDSKYDMPGWMVEEKMYNCEGFTSSYYSNLFSRVLGRLSLRK